MSGAEHPARVDDAPAIVRGEIPDDVVDGTTRFAGRQWIVDEIAAWADRGTERFLVIVGEPGWGKSSLVAWLVGPDPDGPDAPAPPAPQRPQIPWAAWHFCVGTSESTANPNRFSRSIAQQLASRHPEINAEIVRRAAPEIVINAPITATTISGRVIGARIDALTIDGRDPSDVYDLSVRQPLVAGVTDQRPMFIAVDGLDDASGGSETTIVDLVVGSADFPDHVRFLVTTRNDERVLRAFGAASIRPFFVSDSDDETMARRNSADVATFARAVVTADPRGDPSRADTLVNAIVDVAEGNFLVASLLLRHLRDTGTLPDGMPTGLYPLYDAYLRRLLPDTDGAELSAAWTDHYQPLLGTISVARPAAPNQLLPRWLGAADLNQELVRVGPIVEDVVADGSRRLYHRSLADFFAQQDTPGPLRRALTNRYYVNPLRQHQRIVSYFLGRARESAEDWSQADAYALRQLVPHLYALFRLTDDVADRRRLATQLCDIALSDSFQQAQRAIIPDGSATIEACRLAIEVSLEADPGGTPARLRRLAESWEPHIRVQAARILERRGQADPARILKELKGLVR